MSQTEILDALMLLGKGTTREIAKKAGLPIEAAKSNIRDAVKTHKIRAIGRQRSELGGTEFVWEVSQ